MNANLLFVLLALGSVARLSRSEDYDHLFTSIENLLTLFEGLKSIATLIEGYAQENEDGNLEFEK